MEEVKRDALWEPLPVPIMVSGAAGRLPARGPGGALLQSYPLLLAAAAWYAGLILVFRVPGNLPPATPWIAAACAVVIALMTLRRPDKLRPSIAYLLILALLFVTAGYRAFTRIEASQAYLSPPE